MQIAVCMEGLNLEKLLREAAAQGVLLRRVCRQGKRKIRANISARDLPLLQAMCAQSGWEITQIQPGMAVRAVRFAKRRKMLFAGMAVCMLLVWLSSQMILAVRIVNAQENIAEVRHFLRDSGVFAGRRKSAFSLDALREQMALCLPGLSFAGMRYAGSTLIVDCYPSVPGEQMDAAGGGMDIVALQPGIITHVAVVSGTPAVEIGQVVHRGQVLIRGEERTQRAQTYPVRAQGQVRARVWARGEAKASLRYAHTVETGRTRRRVTLHLAGRSHVVRDAVPFESQDVSVERERVVGLYLPLWREIETYAETVVYTMPRERAQALSAAQGAAEEIAKKQCPFNALILDKRVDYSMIDNEFVYATVVIEYEDSIAGRLGGR